MTVIDAFHVFLEDAPVTFVISHVHLLLLKLGDQFGMFLDRVGHSVHSVGLCQDLSLCLCKSGLVVVNFVQV